MNFQLFGLNIHLYKRSSFIISDRQKLSFTEKMVMRLEKLTSIILLHHSCWFFLKNVIEIKAINLMKMSPKNIYLIDDLNRCLTHVNHHVNSGLFSSADDFNFIISNPENQIDLIWINHDNTRPRKRIDFINN
jgi:hypothetical protein